MNFEDRFDEIKDDLIFHFTSRQVALEHILFSRTLKFSLRCNVDDIAECSPYVIMTGSNAEEYFTNEEERISMETVLRFQKDINNKIKILCFCQNHMSVYSTFIERPRMWSQYSKGQTGICLVFSKSILLQELEKQVDDYTCYMFDNVKYQDYPIDESKLCIPKSKTIISDYNSFYKQLIFTDLKSMFFKKHKDYQHENEFRIVYGGNDPENLISFNKSLVAVVLGSNFPEVYDPIVFDYRKRYNIPFYQISMVNGYPWVSEYKDQDIEQSVQPDTATVTDLARR